MERKAKQLLYRKKLAQTIESLQEGIKAHMEVEEKERVRTKSFDIRLVGDEVFVSALPKVDPRQMKLAFKGNP